jgi:sporulation protein YlmC with PRC-barrel domain
MALKLRTVSSTIGLEVYTEGGTYVGKIEEALVKGNRITAWKIALGNSALAKRITSAKGVIIDHAMVRAIDDIMIISELVIEQTPAQEKTNE